MESTKGLVDAARLYVRRHFARSVPQWRVFHDLEHTLSVARSTQEIGRGMKVPAEALRMLEIAALFHDCGYANGRAGHEDRSIAMATAWLEAQGANARMLHQVKMLIACTRSGSVPRDQLQRIMRDADNAGTGQADFMRRNELLRLERSQELGRIIAPAEWVKESLTYLSTHRFFTTWASRRYNRQRLLNLKMLRAHARSVSRDVPLAQNKDRFLDRDLSWLDFNARVLQEAQDARTPLLDRLKFLAIHSNNRDEFYRVRVAQLLSLRDLKKSDRSALEVPPERRIARINAEAQAQLKAAGKLYRQVLVPQLAKRGIRLLEAGDLDPGQLAFVRRFFKERVSAMLETAAMRMGNADFIEDRKLYLACDLLHKATKKRKWVLLKVPSDELGRFITLPLRSGSSKARDRVDLMYLEDAIRMCADTYFTGTMLKAAYAFKSSRDAELYLEDEFAESVVDKVRRSLRKRRTGAPSRLLYDTAMPPILLKELRAMLGVKKSDLLKGERYHSHSDLARIPVPGRPELHATPQPPLRHPAFVDQADPYRVIAKGDRLLQFPYHDFREVIDLLRHAARDPEVPRIAITLYRVARGSLVCESLLEAARSGKRVDVHIEIQARFDEGNNLFWGEALEQAGAKVSYGREGTKVHCKLLLIERKEGRSLVRYAYLGTGNFNERTAATYGDLGLLTADRTICQDVAAVFDHLIDPRKAADTRLLSVAPAGLRSDLARMIDAEIANALSGKPAGILMKMNALEDRAMIRKLYMASRAGVPVRLIVRGICCLVPGVAGSSENIEVISIVDRYLEHSRAYVFHNGGQPLVYLASADLMERNLDRRVEVAFPIKDAAVKREVLDMLELQWADEAKARRIDRERTNGFRHPKWRSPGALRSQEEHYLRLKRVAQGQTKRRK